MAPAGEVGPLHERALSVRERIVGKIPQRSGWRISSGGGSVWTTSSAISAAGTRSARRARSASAVPSQFRVEVARIASRSRGERGWRPTPSPVGMRQIRVTTPADRSVIWRARGEADTERIEHGPELGSHPFVPGRRTRSRQPPPIGVGGPSGVRSGRGPGRPGTVRRRRPGSGAGGLTADGLARPSCSRSSCSITSSTSGGSDQAPSDRTRRAQAVAAAKSLASSARSCSSARPARSRASATAGAISSAIRAGRRRPAASPAPATATGAPVWPPGPSPDDGRPARRPLPRLRF